MVWVGHFTASHQHSLESLHHQVVQIQEVLVIANGEQVLAEADARLETLAQLPNLQLLTTQLRALGFSDELQVCGQLHALLVDLSYQTGREELHLRDCT